MKSKKFTAAIIMITLTLLSGCGGGDTSPAPVMSGFWGGTTGTTTTSAIVLANGDTWVVFQEANVTSRFARLQAHASGTGFSGTGSQYLLQTGTAEPASATGTFAQKSLLSGTMSATSGSTLLDLTYNSRYETHAIPADAIGRWVGSFGSGSNVLTMTIEAAGILSGSSTTGCTYSGTIQPRIADPAVFDVTFSEACLVGASRTLSGIATVNAEKTSLFCATTTSDKTSGALFVGQKP